MFIGRGQLIIRNEVDKINKEEIFSWFSEFAEKRPEAIEGVGYEDTGTLVGLALNPIAVVALRSCDETDAIFTISLALSCISGCVTSYAQNGDYVNFDYEGNDPIALMSFIKFLNSKGYLSYVEGDVDNGNGVFSLRGMDNEDGVGIIYYGKRYLRPTSMYEIQYDISDVRGNSELLLLK